MQHVNVGFLLFKHASKMSTLTSGAFQAEVFSPLILFENRRGQGWKHARSKPWYFCSATVKSTFFHGQFLFSEPVFSSPQPLLHPHPRQHRLDGSVWLPSHLWLSLYFLGFNSTNQIYTAAMETCKRRCVCVCVVFNPIIWLPMATICS